MYRIVTHVRGKVNIGERPETMKELTNGILRRVSVCFIARLVYNEYAKKMAV